ncbi:hypothetical protein RQM47_16060 [Rubrivirga sp. S365]|uniref:hypothetical protein n=1 Tax=Rubrivirga sp. S365 TaxID=3076080 RepID=UPI0028C58C42|nr:hypothetical protein [Rubrivirga sp. S365]MDT7858163.1 hypothetical protein [Rubrivirga sp. S365]
MPHDAPARSPWFRPLPSRALLTGAALFAAALAGCDGGPVAGGAPAGPVDPAAESVEGYDAGLLSRAATLGPTDGEYRAPAVAFTSADKPLLRFETAEAFQETAAALERLAAWGGEPLRVHERLRSYLRYRDVAPAAELALADGRGRVVIGDRLVTLGGAAESVVSDLATGAVVERIDLDAELPRFDRGGASRTLLDAATRDGSGPVATSGLTEFTGQDAYEAFILPDLIFAQNGTYNYVTQPRSVDAIFMHDAYRTWTGWRSAKAVTELQWWNSWKQRWEVVEHRELPGAVVRVTMSNHDDGCEVSYSSQTVPPGSTSGDEITAVVGNGRTAGEGVSYSVHEVVVPAASSMDGQPVRISPYRIEGESSRCRTTS